jgi:release factor glutamine methyltransferase
VSTMDLTTIAETLKSAAQTLSCHSESPRLDAELLLGKVMGFSRPALIAHGEDIVAQEAARAYEELISRRLKGAPVAYLTGCAEFWSLPLAVTPAVLVPRPETEMLVEQALQLKSADERCSVLDLGTGSGAIALSIATERPHWNITGVDLSPEALKIAAQNSHDLEITRVRWRLGDWFKSVSGERFDLIVANPPYIGSADPALVRLAAEPAMALTPGPSGLEALSAIIADAPQHLSAGGWLLLEHGSTQAQDVASLLGRRGFQLIRTVQDLAGRARVTLGSVHTQH